MKDPVRKVVRSTKERPKRGEASRTGGSVETLRAVLRMRNSIV